MYSLRASLIETQSSGARHWQESDNGVEDWKEIHEGFMSLLIAC